MKRLNQDFILLAVKIFKGEVFLGSHEIILMNNLRSNNFVLSLIEKERPP
jgi:hypothetical protein